MTGAIKVAVHDDGSTDDNVSSSLIDEHLMAREVITLCKTAIQERRCCPLTLMHAKASASYCVRSTETKM